MNHQDAVAHNKAKAKRTNLGLNISMSESFIMYDCKRLKKIPGYLLRASLVNFAGGDMLAEIPQGTVLHSQIKCLVRFKPSEKLNYDLFLPYLLSISKLSIDKNNE